MKITHSIKLIILLLPVCLGILTLGSCYKVDNDNYLQKEILDNPGPIIEENREVGYFHSIKITGSFNLFIRKETTQSLRLEGESIILPLVATWVENGELFVEKNVSNIRVNVYVSMSEIRNFSIIGSSNIFGEEKFSTDTLHLSTIGSSIINLNVTANSIFSFIVGDSKIELNGSADYHETRLYGTGKLDALELEVPRYDVFVEDAECWIYVTEELNVVIDESGTVYYNGDPAVINSDITGTGQLIKL
jgi:hypothetical protein